jgi:chorismate synthase
MLGNTFGRIFQISTCGESYGWKATAEDASYGGGLLTIVNGVPAGIKIDVKQIQDELDKRRPGQSPIDSPRLETDRVEIISGWLDGVTSGGPLGMVIRNVDTQDLHIGQYRDVKDVIRPGHAEVNFFHRYGEFGDWCGAGRASGRETVSRVAGGAVAKQILGMRGIEILSHVIESHGIKGRCVADGTMAFEEVRENYRKNDLNCCDLEMAEVMLADLLEVAQAGDTAGGALEVIVRGVPAGVGEPVFDKLKATIAHGICSVAAMTGIEFGAGAKAASMLGSEWNDQPFVKDGCVRWETNHAGGFLGGFSTGEDIVFKVYVKATPTISKDQQTVDMTTMTDGVLSAITRRDISLLPRWYPCAEAMTACAVLDGLFLTEAWYGMSTHMDPKWRAMTKPRHTGNYEK